MNVRVPKATASSASSSHTAAHDTAATEPGEVLVESVLNLLAIQAFGFSDHQLRQEAGGLAQALEVFGSCRSAGSVGAGPTRRGFSWEGKPA